MNLLTKEECEKALETLSSPPYESSCGGCICGVSDCGDCPNNKANKLLNQLIDEHFDNPPLKFEELDKGYPIYDNDEIVCGWKFIYMIDKEYKQLLLIDEEGNVDWVNYEENRFYRKECYHE